MYCTICVDIFKFYGSTSGIVEICNVISVGVKVSYQGHDHYEWLVLSNSATDLVKLLMSVCRKYYMDLVISFPA